jgi:hypothetical protein
MLVTCGPHGSSPVVLRTFNLAGISMSGELRKLGTGAAAVTIAVLAACGDSTGNNGGNPPAAPAAVQACQVSRNSVRLEWAPSASATGYVLERADVQPNFPGTTTSVTDTFSVVAGLTDNVISYFRVRASNADGNGDPSSVVSFTAQSAEGVIQGDLTCNRTLVKDTVYTIRGYAKVKNGATLTIPAGTTLRGDANVAGSSLWILRGARIQANGTVAEPIVFTSSKAAGTRAPGDWGGLIIVGNGIINKTGTILTEGPAGTNEQYSAGTDNTDNSGTLRYVRVEFAGYDVSGGAGQELNSFSMYAVGSGTTLEYAQSLTGLDDAFEFWGGAVDGRYLVSYESGDDHFDWSEGFRGRVQFLIAFQSARVQPAPGRGTLSTDPQGFEGDGCDGTGCASGHTSTPFSQPVWANFTIVGPGTGTAITSGGDIGGVIRRGTGGTFTGGIFARWQRAGLSVRDTATANRFAVDSLILANVLFVENARSYNQSATASEPLDTTTAFAADNHVKPAGAATTILTNLTPGALDFTPVAASAAVNGGNTIAVPAARLANFFGGTLTQTAYFGAVDPAGPQWYAGWTSYVVN